MNHSEYSERQNRNLTPGSRPLSWLAAIALAVTLIVLIAPAARAGYSLSFNGLNNYVNLTLASPPASNYTISAWVFLSAGGTIGTRLGVLSGPCGTTIEFLIRSSTTNAADPQYLELGRCGSFNGTNSSSAVPLHAWTHVAVTVSATNTVSYFINGHPAGTWTNAALNFSLGTNVNLGDNVVRRFNGILDDVQIWNRALSQSEIQTYMPASLTGKESGLYAYYPFDEGSGATAADGASANGGSAGTLINNPSWVLGWPNVVTPVSYWRMGEDDMVGAPGLAYHTSDETGGRTMTLVGGPFYNSANLSPVAAVHTGSDWCMWFFTGTYGTAALIPTLTDNFGIELWVMPEETTAQTCLAYNGNTGTSGWGLYKIGATYQGIFGGVAFIGSAAVTAGAWTHLALVRNNGTTTLYMNGVAAGSTTAAPNPPTGSFAVAANPQNPANDQFGNNYGYLDEVRVFTFPPGAFTVNDLLLNTRVPPKVTVLPATGVTATNATLNGTVNPAGKVTTAFFQYGLTTSYGNIGAFQSLGAGNAALAMSNGVSYVSAPAGTNWIPRGSNRPWSCVASSADGTKLVAGAFVDQIYTSTDSGVTWTPRDSNRYWQSVASSADGTKLVAVDSGLNFMIPGGRIYTSTDSGVTWTPRDSNRNWQSVASSADGTKLVAVEGGPYVGLIYTSTDSGVTWTPRDSSRDWYGVASSADGTKLVAVVIDDQIYTSSDSGVSWTPRESNRVWYSVASSADGTKLVAVVLDGYIYTSTDSGVTWTPRDSNRHWQSVASSADGTKLVGVVNGNGNGSIVGIYTSTDSGVTWAPQSNNPENYWQCVASSADGTKLVAGQNGSLYTCSGATGNLTPGTTYHYQLVGISSVGTELSTDQTFTTLPLPPVVATLPASSITATNATLNGTVNPDGGVTTAYFQYGLATNYGSFSATNTLAATNTTLSVSNLIGNLSAGTRYHFQLVASNSAGTTLGADQTFTTVGFPAVTTLAASGITATNATLNGTVNPKGGVTTAYFQYGLATSYGSFSATNTLAGTNVNLSVSSFISSLSPDIAYHFRLVGINSAGTTPGADQTFTTAVAAPAVTSLSASNITATNATLNGTVNPEGGVTTAYFQYGLTTNYVSFSATKTLAATNVNLSVSNLIGSLSSGTAYHFRLVGINSAGTTPGADQTFTTAVAAPAVTTLPASNITTTNATLNGTANPNGAATTAYFQYGLTTNYGSIGSLASLPATNATLALAGTISSLSGPAGTNWTAQTNAPSGPWISVASSADGTKLAAVVNGGRIYTSSDSGASWRAQAASPSTYWKSLASSADGTKLVAAVSGGQIYTSRDSGVTWTPRDSNRYWQSVASAADGAKLVAVEYGGQIYTSTNSGVAWTANDSDRGWQSVASSADGTKLVALSNGGQIYTSSDSGVSWGAQAASPSTSWYSVASSADGTKLVAAVSGGQIYTSTDSGVTWTPRDSNRGWQSVASSADGTKLVAVEYGGQIYTSTNSGVTWTAQTNAPSTSWYSVASSADGTKLVGVEYNGQIYTSSGITSNLTPGTTYHYQLLGINSAGTTLGADISFTTAVAAQPAAFTLKGAIQLAGGAFQLTFTNLSGLGFTVFTSTNVAAPLNTWSNLGPAVESPASSGQYQFTDPQATNKAAQFYRVRSP